RKCKEMVPGIGRQSDDIEISGYLQRVLSAEKNNETKRNPVPGLHNWISERDCLLKAADVEVFALYTELLH
ncbi:MAG: hypothetical protein K9K79_14055, partial [Desulfohalobiaceae bacterium]|nr:hypothetical protein [Desulfohalobiaceae bacterium]